MPRPKKQHLKQRKDGRYCCRYRDMQFFGATEDEALEKREAYKRSRRITTKKTVGEYAAWWLPIYKAGVKATTYNAYASLLTHALAPISGVMLSGVTADHMAEVYAALSGKSASYIGKVRILLTEMFDSAQDAGYIGENPARARSVKPPKGTRGTHRAITEEERQKILSTPHRMQLAALVMLYCGLRRGEALAVRAEDFSGDALTVRRAVYYVGNTPQISTPKTTSGIRCVPVPPFILAMLPASGLIAPGLDGEEMTEQAFQRAWQSYQRAIGSDLRAHDLRHSYCTWLRDSGVDIHQAIIWMGHADETMVLRVYDHPGPQREADAKTRLFSQFGMQNGMQSVQPPQQKRTPRRSPPVK